MDQDAAAYFADLFRSVPEKAFVAERRAVRFHDGAWPLAHKCHENVARWIAENPGCHALRGWLVSSYHVIGGAVFDAHSLLCDPATGPFEITPLPAATLRFIGHPGDEASFWKISGRWAQYSYVPHQA